MTTRGAWQKEIVPYLSDMAIRHIALDYGYAIARAFRRKTIESVAEDILAAYMDHKRHCGTVGAIGHSLGTLGIGRALRKYPEMRLERIVIFGSILPRDYPWRPLARLGQVGAVLHEIGENDPWPRRARWILPGAGPSGCDGFIGCDQVVTERRYAWSDHSSLQHPLHYTSVWIPFLLGEEV